MSNSGTKTKPGWRLAVLSGLLASAMLPACARYDPKWTPDSVAPPRSIEAGLARIVQDSEQATAPKSGKKGPPSESKDTMTAQPAMTIALDEAIRMALDQNLAIAAERYSPLISLNAIPEARAVFDPTLSIRASYAEQNLPGTSVTKEQTVTTALSSLENLFSTNQNASTGSGTSSSSSASATTTGSQVTSALSALQTSITTAQSKLQSAEDLVRAVDAYKNPTTINSKRTDSSATISTYLPTGTEFYVTAGITRDRSSNNTESQYAGTWAVGVNQALLQGSGPAVNLVALRQARNTAAMSNYAFQDYVLDAVQQVENTYWGLALAQEALKIQEFSLHLTEEQLNLNKALIEVGKLAESDLVTAEAEVASREAELVNAQGDLEAQTVEFWRLLNAERDSAGHITFGPIEIPVPAVAIVVPEQSVQLAKLYRPDLAQARLNISNRQLDVIQTRNGLLPRLDAFASYGRLSQGANMGSWNDDLDSSDYDNFEVGLNFEWAIGSRAERARHRSAVLRVDQAEDSLRNMEQLVETDVLQAAVEVRRQQKRIEASSKEVLNREEQLRVETDQFRLGRSTNLDVLQVQRDLIQAKVDEATAKVLLLQAVAALYRAEGTNLVRRGIAIQAEKETES